MDLNAPLGMRPPPPTRRRVLPIVVVSLAALAAAGLALVLATADPRGGEPSAVAVIPPPAPRPTVGSLPTVTPDLMATGSVAGPQIRPDARPPEMNAASLEGGVKVYRGGPQGQAARPGETGPVVIDISRALDESARKKPALAGAAPALVSGTPSAPSAGPPRLAIFVGGMGLSASATRMAIETMPPAVDLAFVPYGEKLGAEVDSAKAKGHEILLQVPMQSAPGQRLGPHTLRPAEPPQELADDLTWLMGRFDGYAGVANLLGAPVTADPATMTSLLKAVTGRGLFYVDDGTSARSLGPSLAPKEGLVAAQADVVLDATGDPAVVRANLDRLVAVARRTGHAIGMASGLPEHLGTIARFAADLAGKGVVLVPVSALAGHTANVATTR